MTNDKTGGVLCVAYAVDQPPAASDQTRRDEQEGGQVVGEAQAEEEGEGVKREVGGVGRVDERETQKKDSGEEGSVEGVGFDFGGARPKSGGDAEGESGDERRERRSPQPAGEALHADC